MTSMLKTLISTFVLTLPAYAHFQLQFPPPRGVFVEDSEPDFCDGYNSPAANRSQFPLTGGFIIMNSEHPQWSSETLLSIVSNSTSFNDFLPVTPFFQQQGAGVFCVPLDFASTNATGLKDGQNVTIQILFSGGDGPLYQCADLTLSSNFSAPSSVNCTNKITNPPSSFVNTTGTSQTTPSSTPQSAASRAVISMGGAVSVGFFANALVSHPAALNISVSGIYYQAKLFDPQHDAKSHTADSGVLAECPDRVCGNSAEVTGETIDLNLVFPVRRD